VIEDEIYARVVAAMSEPHREYHTMRHLAEMFMLAHLRGLRLSDEQIYAICLHDVVYRVPADKKESNEVASAKLAREWMSKDFRKGFVERVCQIILDTEKELPTIPDSKLVIDLDLAGLALNYWQNRILIRQEFSCVDDDAFYAGRFKWIQSMLARDSIFVSGRFSDLERAAVENLKAELQMLEKN